MITRSEALEKEFDYGRAFSRNRGFLSGDDQRALNESHVAIVGLGGTGSIQAEVLARMGVGHFTIADPDAFELSNLNRQLGATTATLQRSKCEVVRERILSINPTATVRTFADGLTAENVADMLTGVNLVMDSLDFFALRERVTLARMARAKGLWVVNTAPLGYGASVLLFDPRGLTFENYFGLIDEMSEERRLFHFFVGIAPRILMSRYFDPRNAIKGQLSCVAPAFFFAAGFAGTEAARILTGARGVRGAPYVFQVDGRLRTAVSSSGRGWLGRAWRKTRPFVMEAALKWTLGVGPDDLFRKPEPEPVFGLPARGEGVSDVPVVDFVRAAQLAPTGDNCQPWRFEWDGEVLLIRHDAGRGRHALNRANNASFISLGCVIESIAIAARASGFSAVAEVLTQGMEPGARIRFTPKPDLPENLAGTLAGRATDRRPFRRDALDPDTIEAIAADEMRFLGCQLYFTDDLSESFYRFAVQSERFVWETRRVHADLMRWIRFTDEEAKRTRDGMSWLSCGMSRVESWVVRAARNFTVQRILNAGPFLAGAARKTRHLLRHSSGVFCITVRTKNPEDAVAAGRLWLRVWCRLNARGYGVQPVMAPILPVYAAGTGALEPDLTPHYQRVFSEGLRVLRSAFGFPGGELPVVMFRCGPSSAVPHSHRTMRLPVEKVLTCRQSSAISNR